MGSGVVGERDRGELWTHTGIIILGQVFMHGHDLIITSWDTFNLKRREIRKPVFFLHMFLFFVIVG